MRDPKRIKPTLDLVRRIWEQHLDLRLGQLICNVSISKDTYYWEDDVLVTALKKFYREAK